MQKKFDKFLEKHSSYIQNNSFITRINDKLHVLILIISDCNVKVFENEHKLTKLKLDKHIYIQRNTIKPMAILLD